MKKVICLLAVFSTGCATTIIAPDGTQYKGRAAVAVYAHQLQQQQLSKRWEWLTAESSRMPKNESDAIGKNMVMQALILAGVPSGGGEYFQYLASRNQMWSQIAQSALYVLGPAVVAELLGVNHGSGGTEIEETINIGGDVIASNSGEFGFAPPIGGSTTGLVPEDSRAPAHQHRALSIGGIGNQIGTLESTNAFYRSLSGLNRRSGTLAIGEQGKVNSFLDNQSGSAPIQDDADDVSNEFGFLQ